jgi:hypothetical protein
MYIGEVIETVCARMVRPEKRRGVGAEPVLGPLSALAEHFNSVFTSLRKPRFKTIEQGKGTGLGT